MRQRFSLIVIVDVAVVVVVVVVVVVLVVVDVTGNIVTIDVVVVVVVVGVIVGFGGDAIVVGNSIWVFVGLDFQYLCSHRILYHKKKKNNLKIHIMDGTYFYRTNILLIVNVSNGYF